MKRILFCLLVAIISVAANAQTKTLTIDFSKGNEWIQPFIYNVDPIRGRTYSIKDGWKIKFSDGALMDKGEGSGYPYKLKTNDDNRFMYHRGPLFMVGTRSTFCIIFEVHLDVEYTGVDIFNENGYQATAVRYYYDYFGLEPKFTAMNGKETVGYSKTETKLFEYFTTQNNIAGEDYVVNCTLNQPSKTITFGQGARNVSTKQSKDFPNYWSIDEQLDWSPLSSFEGASCTLYKIEIDYEPAKYASTYAELLAQYKELEGKYGAAEGEIADLKNSLEVEYANNEALDAQVKQLQEDLEKEEADLGETLDDLASAQAAARKYRSLYKLSKKDLEAMNKAYPGGMPSLYGSPSLGNDKKQSVDFGVMGVYFGDEEELTMSSNGLNYKAGLQFGSDGNLYIGTKQGYCITRVEVEYTKAGETDNTNIDFRASASSDANTAWTEHAKRHHATYVASDAIDDKSGERFIKVRGINIVPAAGETILIRDIKVWTAPCATRYFDLPSGTNGYFNYSDFNGVNAIGAATIKIDGNTKSGTYDLSGRKLTEPQKGINIIDGKKVLVK